MNEQIKWNDEDLIQAVIQYSKEKNVNLHPETAMQIVKEIKDSIKNNTLGELQFALNKFKQDFNLINEKTSSFNNFETCLSKISKLLDIFIKNASVFQDELKEIDSKPLTPEQEEELKRRIKTDIIDPIRLKEEIIVQEYQSSKKEADELISIISKREQFVKEMKPLLDQLESEAYEIENGKFKINEEGLRQIKDESKKKEFINTLAKAKAILKSIAELYIKLNFCQVKMSTLKAGQQTFHDQTYLNTNIGIGGVTEYLRKTISPWIENLKSMASFIKESSIFKVQLKPEIQSKIENIYRQLGFKGSQMLEIQSSNVDPKITKITIQDIEKTGSFKNKLSQIQNSTDTSSEDKKLAQEFLSKFNLNSQQAIDNFNNLPLTPSKGKLIYWLLDPPTEKTESRARSISGSLAPKESLDEQGVNVKNWGPVESPHTQEFTETEDESHQAKKSTSPRAFGETAPLLEAILPNNHWLILETLAKTELAPVKMKNADILKSQIEKQIKETNPNISEKELSDKIMKELRNFDIKQSNKDVVLSVISNPRTPWWIIANAATKGMNEDIKKYAISVLIDRFGLIPEYSVDTDEEGTPLEGATPKYTRNKETGEYIFIPIKGWAEKGSKERDLIKEKLKKRQLFPGQITASIKKAQQADTKFLDDQIKQLQNQITQIQQRKKEVQDQQNRTNEIARQQKITNPQTTTTQPIQSTPTIAKNNFGILI